LSGLATICSEGPNDRKFMKYAGPYTLKTTPLSEPVDE